MTKNYSPVPCAGQMIFFTTVWVNGYTHLDKTWLGSLGNSQARWRCSSIGLMQSGFKCLYVVEYRDWYFAAYVDMIHVRSCTY